MKSEIDFNNLYLSIYVDGDSNTSYSRDYFHINFWLATKDDKTFYGRDSWVSHVRIHCQADLELKHQSYGWKVAIVNKDIDDAEQAQDIAKFLKKWDTGYHKLCEKFGYPKSYGQFVCYFMEVFKIKFAAKRLPGSGTPCHAQYSPSSLEYNVDSWLDAWHKAKNTAWHRHQESA